MTLLVVTPPPALLTLEQVKAHLRPDTDEDDAYLMALTATAQGHLDGPAGWLGLSIGPQVLELRAADFDAVGDGGRLPCGPVSAIAAIAIMAPDGTEAEVDPALYLLDDDTLTLASGRSWPVTAVRPDAVRVRYAAGYADPEAVPPPILQAMLIVIALLYENRLGDVDIERNRTVASLLGPFRRWGR